MSKNCRDVGVEISLIARERIRKVFQVLLYGGTLRYSRGHVSTGTCVGEYVIHGETRGNDAILRPLF